MATKRIPILGFNAQVDDSGDCFPQRYSAYATNKVWKHRILAFNDSGTRIGVYGAFEVPQNYVTLPEVIVSWTSATATGNVVWDFEYRSVAADDVESLDQVGTQESVTVTDAAPSAIHELLEAVMALTAGNLSPGDLVEFFFARDGVSASDTHGDKALLHGLALRYSDT